MQVYLDGIAVSNLSGSEKQKEELTASLDETLSQIRKNLEIQDTAAPNEDALLASQSITYNKTVLDLLTGTTEQQVIVAILQIVVIFLDTATQIQ